MFGLKIAALMLVVMGVVGGVGYWYYNDTQKRLAILNAVSYTHLTLPTKA